MEPITEEIVEDFFDDDEISPGIMTAMSDLAEVIAVTDDNVKILDSQLKDSKAELNAMRTQLNELMMTNNCSNGHKFDNGLYLKPYVKTDIYRAGGVTDEVLFAWLQENGLSSIIKPTVHYATLSATMKAELEQGHDLPEIFNVSEKHSVKFVGNGKVKFLAERTEGGVKAEAELTYEDLDVSEGLLYGTFRAAAKKREQDFDKAIEDISEGGESL